MRDALLMFLLALGGSEPPAGVDAAPSALSRPHDVGVVARGLHGAWVGKRVTAAGTYAFDVTFSEASTPGAIVAHFRFIEGITRRILFRQGRLAAGTISFPLSDSRQIVLKLADPNRLVGQFVGESAHDCASAPLCGTLEIFRSRRSP